MSSQHNSLAEKDRQTGRRHSIGWISRFLIIIILTCSLTGISMATIDAAPASIPDSDPAVFTFASMGDGHSEWSRFAEIVDQINSLNPNFVLFNGDVENDGVYDGRWKGLAHDEHDAHDDGR